MWTPTYKFTCSSCGKKSQSKDASCVMCRKCKAWNKPGKGQTSIFALSPELTGYQQKDDIKK